MTRFFYLTDRRRKKRSSEKRKDDTENELLIGDLRQRSRPEALAMQQKKSASKSIELENSNLSGKCVDYRCLDNCCRINERIVISELSTNHHKTRKHLVLSSSSRTRRRRREEMFVILFPKAKLEKTTLNHQQRSE